MIGLVILLVVIGGWLALGKKKPATTSSDTTAVASANSVAINGMAFLPNSIKVKVGTTVTWTNQDPYAHTVTGDGSNIPKGFDSGNLGTGKSYSYTFTSPGTFTYHCTIHPQLIGSVTVQ